MYTHLISNDKNKGVYMRGSKEFLNRAYRRIEYTRITEVIYKLFEKQAIVDLSCPELCSFSQESVLRVFRIMDKFGEFSMMKDDDTNRYFLVLNNQEC